MLWSKQSLRVKNIHLSNEKNPGCLGYIGDDMLPSYGYVGIIINHYNDPYEPTSIMKCRWWVLITAHLKKTSQVVLEFLQEDR